MISRGDPRGVATPRVVGEDALAIVAAPGGDWLGCGAG